MKKLLLTTILLLLASPVAAWNWPVITAMQSGGGGGGETTERLTPDGEGSTAGQWTDGTGSDDTYEHIDEGWDNRGDGIEIASTDSGGITSKTFSASSMGAGDTCTQLSFDVYGKDGNGGTGVTIEISYSTDGGTSWVGTDTMSISGNTSADYNVTYDSLSLSQSEVNALEIRLTNVGTPEAVAAVVDTLSVEITY